MAAVSIPVVLALVVILSLSIAQTTIGHVSPASAPGPAEFTYSTISSPGPAPSPGPSGDNFVDYDLKSTSSAKDSHTDSVYLKTNMAFAANKMELFTQNKIEPKIKESSTDDATKECLSICSEVYSSAVDALKKGMEDIKVGDYTKANFDMSAFMNDIDTCSECASVLDDPELQKFEDWIKGVGDDCFEKIAKYSTFSMNNLV